MADEISDLRLFVRMAAAGSLSETARRLNSSLPAMSRRLSAMERRLGARLIDRSTRRFVLTEEGALLYERSLAILNEIDQIEAERAEGKAIWDAMVDAAMSRFRPIELTAIRQWTTFWDRWRSRSWAACWSQPS